MFDGIKIIISISRSDFNVTCDMFMVLTDAAFF